MSNNLIKSFRAAWFFWLFFLCLGFASGCAGETGTISPRADWMAGLTFAFLCAVWVTRDARQRERMAGYGFPALVFFFWPVFGPVYLFQTRGARAFLSLLALLTGFLVISAVGTFIGAVLAG